MRWRWVGLGISAIVVLALVGGVAWAISERTLRAELELARRDFASARYALARTRLTDLAARWPRRAEVQYELGLCEQARGAPDAALSAWERVPDDSPFALRAALARGRLAMTLGRFTLAEDSFRFAAHDPSPMATPARHALPFLLAQEGRIDEALEWIEALWHDPKLAQAEDRLALLHDHISLEFEAIPVEGNLTVLDRLPGAESDDRIWLSRAYLALRSGKLDEAKTWLDACLKRRPDDLAVWRARLDWAVAANRVDLLLDALGHLPTSGLSARRLAALRVWLAARQGDPRAEQAALERQVNVDPADTVALERLSDLEIRAGHLQQSQALRRRKAELDQARERYNVLFMANHLDADAGEMASLAEKLGRHFEARAFRSLLAQRQPSASAPDAATPTPAPPAPPRPGHDQTLAQLLAAELAPLRRDSQASANPSPSAVPQFRDDCQAAGLASFRLDTGASQIHQLPETMGGGVGLLDYDDDGWLDVYAVQEGPFPDGPFAGDTLFRNRGDGTFEDTTARAGIAAMPRGYGHGVAVGDYDNDGHPDLFVTRWRSYALYHNRGDGTFEDATQRAGLGGDRDWPTSAAFADLDADGDLDLYVCHYGAWDPAHPRLCMDPSKVRYISCNPRDIEPTSDHVFRNDGGKFVDVTQEAGVVEREGRGLGVVAADLDDDGKVDLYIANDSSANSLLHNLGGFRFEEVAVVAGAAANASGGYQAGMGVACGDLDGDGRPDLFVTNFYDEGTTYYQNLGGGLFADRSAAIGLAAASRYRLGFGIALLDANNDGWPDLLTANGHVNDMRPTFPFAMPAQFFLGSPGGRLSDVSDRAGPPLRQPHVGRGLAAGDVDNDGRVDALMVSQDEPLVYLHNRAAGGGHFVTLRLEGTTSNRDGVGTKITLTSGGRRQVAQRLGGGSFLSASDPRLHFGLGGSTVVDSIELRWPSGRVDRYRDLAADAAYLLREGDAVAKPLHGYAKRPAPSPAQSGGVKATGP